jgi:MFS family permease
MRRRALGGHGLLRLVRRIAVDVTPLRESREFRRLVAGQVVSSLGGQAVLVALPFQIYVTSHSAALVGLLGAFELGPIIATSLVGGVMADRRDRRQVLALAQVGVIVVATGMSVLSLTVHRPPVDVILLLGGGLAGCTALDGVARASIIAGVLGPDNLRSGLALNEVLGQASAVVGPGLGGILIAALGGVGWIYALDAVSCVGILIAALSIAPQPPLGIENHPPVLESLKEGVRFVAATKAVAGSLAIDINAMMFGMPRALFAVLSLTVYHAGASGTGLLYSAIAIGGTLSVLGSGWVQTVNRLGRVTIGMVLIWGVSIGAAGLVRSILLAAILLAIAGMADGLSAVCRATISQTLTPDRLRGRMSSVFSLVVTSGPRLGDMESGFVAGLAGALNSVLLGGIGCVVGVGVTVLAFPELVAYEADTAAELMRVQNAAPMTELADTCVTSTTSARPGTP